MEQREITYSIYRMQMQGLAPMVLLAKGFSYHLANEISFQWGLTHKDTALVPEYEDEDEY